MIARWRSGRAVACFGVRPLEEAVYAAAVRRRGSEISKPRNRRNGPGKTVSGARRQQALAD
jgi:hypothetical protein